MHMLNSWRANLLCRNKLESSQSNKSLQTQGLNVQPMFQLAFINVVEQLGNSFIIQYTSRSHITLYTDCHGTYRCYYSISNLYAVYVMEKLEKYQWMGQKHTINSLYKHTWSHLRTSGFHAGPWLLHCWVCVYVAPRMLCHIHVYQGM